MPPSATAATTPATLPTFSSPSTAPGIFGASPARCLAYRVQLDRSPFAVVFRLFAFKGVGGVGVGRSGPECRWWRGRRAHPAASRAQVRMEGCGGEWFGVPVPRLFLFVGALHPIRRQCTSSVRVHRHVTGAPPRNGCSALRACGGCGGCRGCGGLLCLSCLPLGLSSAWGTSWCLCGTSCCGSSEMSHVSPRHVFQTLKSHRWNSAVFSIPMKS